MNQPAAQAPRAPVTMRLTRRSRVDYGFELRELVKRRELIRYLTTSMLKAGHRELALGQLWWLLEPVFSMLIFYFLVTVIFQRGMPNYGVFVFCAILSYRWFTQAVSQSQSIIVSIGGLMRDIAFPKAVYPIALVISNLVNFSFGLIFLFVLMLATGIYPTWQWLWMGPLLVQFFVMTLGVTLLVSALTVLFQDLKNIMIFVFQIVFYMSPSLYTVDHLPARYRELYMLNPFAVIFTSWRNVLMYDLPPVFPHFWGVCALSAALLVVGYMVFVRLEKVFPKIL